ncbi:MAG: hypothetical protein R8J41_05850 [Alphaproteobacteria bacterium]|nr:hypothetical protein [Alphaproteobacteria bacterium]
MTSASSMTAASVMARAFAFLAPIPFVTAYFETPVVALWFVILTFQAFATAVIGVLPTILMHMVSYANAGSSQIGNQRVGFDSTDNGGPNTLLLSQLARFLSSTFVVCALAWIVVAGSVGSWIVWRPIQASGLGIEGYQAWAVFSGAMAVRLGMQAYATFLLGRGSVAEVRRLEAFTWTVSGLATVGSLVVFPNFLLSMVLLQLPLFINLILLRRMAMRQGWRRATRQQMATVSLLPEVWPRALRGGVGVFMSSLVIYGSGILFAQFGESEDVAAFAFALNIFGIVGQLALAPLFGALPSLSAHLARGQLDDQNALAQSVMLKGLLIYAAAVPLVPAGVYIANLFLPVPLLFVDLHLWALLAIANFMFRYGAMHLHYFTITNDIRWHIVDGVNTTLFLGLLALEGVSSMYVFPICQLIALALFYVPYARVLTLRKFEFGWKRDLSYAAVPAGLAAMSLVVLEAL